MRLTLTNTDSCWSSILRSSIKTISRFKNWLKNFLGKKLFIDLDIVAEEIPRQKLKGKINT